jgi:hypothetical protein
MESFVTNVAICAGHTARAENSVTPNAATNMQLACSLQRGVHYMQLAYHAHHVDGCALHASKAHMCLAHVQSYQGYESQSRSICSTALTQVPSYAPYAVYKSSHLHDSNPATSAFSKPCGGDDICSDKCAAVT